MKKYLRNIDIQTTGNRYDITPLFADFNDLKELVEDLTAHFLNNGIDYIAAIDALGFIGLNP